MLFLSLMLMFIFILSMIIMSLSILLAKKTITNREKNSPFECGFDPFSLSRMPFSIHFFMIAIIFLIFDVEITLLIPMTSNMTKSTLSEWSLTLITFMIILLMGLYHEWNQGALKWNNL